MAEITTMEADKLRAELTAALREHKAEQREISQTLVKSMDKMGENIEKLSDTVSRMEALHVEINHQNRRLDAIDMTSRDNTKEINAMGKKLAIADSFVTSVNRLQYGVWGALIIAVIFAAFQVSK